MANDQLPISEEPYRNRRRYQDILLLLLLLVFMVIICSWLAAIKQQAERQRAVVKAIEALGGKVWHEGKGPPALSEQPGPIWWKLLCGNEFVYQVTFHNNELKNADLQQLRELTHLCHIYLDDTQVTDVGLEHISGMNQLLLLSLKNTPITDAGLEHLKELTQLCELNLQGTQVTDQGVRRLRKALPKCEIKH